MNRTILLVDDDAKLRALMSEYLEGYGFRVVTLPDGFAVCETILNESPQIVILDVMMPKKDGLSVLAEIREKHATPVIMLTAKGQDEDRIVGLELGADDYIPKPFNPRELLARIKAVLRRSDLKEESKPEPAGEDRIRAGGLTLNRSKRVLEVEGDEIALSATEYKILETMMTRPNTVFSRDELLNLARGRDFMAFDRSVDVHISKLRAKLEPYPEYGKCIKTVWGMGYMFEEPS